MDLAPMKSILTHIAGEVKSADGYVKSARTNTDENVRNLYLDLAVGELMDIVTMAEYISHTIEEG